MDETLEKSNRGLVRPLVGTIFLCPEIRRVHGPASGHTPSMTFNRAALLALIGTDLRAASKIVRITSTY
jgi:hypothetical protein